MIRSWAAALRDLLRGYTDADVRSLQRRLHELSACTDGAMIWLSERETQALSRGHVIGVWRINTLAIDRGRARVKLSRPATGT